MAKHYSLRSGGPDAGEDNRCHVHHPVPRTAQEPPNGLCQTGRSLGRIRNALAGVLLGAWVAVSRVLAQNAPPDFTAFVKQQIPAVVAIMSRRSPRAPCCM